MPGLSGRMSTVIKAKISKLLDRAEDPAETLEYSYQKQIELLQNVKKGIADVVTSKKRLQLQEQKLRDQVVKLDTQARQALAAGNEDLARTALERKNVAQTELQSLDSQVAQLEQQQEQMTASEQKLRAKIEQFRSQEGGHQGAVLGRRGAGPDLRGGDRRRRGDGRRGPGDAARARQDREHEGPRRRRAGARGRGHVRGPDRSSAPARTTSTVSCVQLSSTSEVDSELAKMKAELGTGSASGRRARRRVAGRRRARGRSRRQFRPRARRRDRPDRHRGAVRARRRATARHSTSSTTTRSTRARWMTRTTFHAAVRAPAGLRAE